MSINLQYFYVRRNALILKCDYVGHNLELGSEFIQWLKTSSKSYEKMTQEISCLLGYNWKPLNDIEFKELTKKKRAY